jgi:hypothetical protein
MKKIAITQELLDIANQLDNMKLFNEANTITKIAHIVVAEDYKHDPMVYNPDEKDADVQEAHSMDYLDAMEALNKLVESGELNPQELSQIQSILSDSDEGPDPFKEMSFDEDDEHYMTDEELDEQFDNDPSDMDDDEDDDRRDKNHRKNDGHNFFQDEDDF